MESMFECFEGFCYANNNHVFCGVQGGKVKVFSLTDKQWVRDLESGEEDFEVVKICGGSVGSLCGHSLEQQGKSA